MNWDEVRCCPGSRSLSWIENNQTEKLVLARVATCGRSFGPVWTRFPTSGSSVFVLFYVIAAPHTAISIFNSIFFCLTFDLFLFSLNWVKLGFCSFVKLFIYKLVLFGFDISFC